MLNRKVAVNFALEEPTHLRYIETTFALQNAGLEWILNHPEARGIVVPPELMQESLLEIVRREGAIARGVAADRALNRVDAFREERARFASGGDFYSREFPDEDPSRGATRSSGSGLNSLGLDMTMLKR